MIDYKIEKKGVMIKKTPIYKDKEPKGKTALKSEDVSNLIVTTASGNKYDADEKSQMRMLKILYYMKEKNIETISWKLADNTIEDVSYDELQEAILISIENQTNIWLGL